jgi:hypothetical protein
VVGVTGFEPVTLRLSSACSNQLSYTPRLCAGALWRGKPAGWPVNRARSATASIAGWLAEPKPAGPTAKEARLRFAATARQPSSFATLRAKAGGAEETRTPDL